MVKVASILICISALVSCVSVTPVTVKSMTDERLCSLLGPAWIKTYDEIRILNYEASQRSLGCANGHVLYRNKSPSIPAQRSPSTAISGSGFFIEDGAYILTNAHVVAACADMNNISITNDYRWSTTASIYKIDHFLDLALLKTPEPKAPLQRLKTFNVNFRSPETPVRLGDDVVTLGYPLGKSIGTNLRATSGAVSALVGMNDNWDTFQIDASIQPGNSGGPVIDRSGFVIGMVSSKLDEISSIQRFGTSTQNVNYAIHTKAILRFLSPYKLDLTVMPAGNELSKADAIESARKSVVLIECESGS